MSPRSEVPKNETRIIADRHSPILASKSQNWSSGPRPETRPATSTMKANSFFRSKLWSRPPQGNLEKDAGKQYRDHSARSTSSINLGSRTTPYKTCYFVCIYIYIYIYMSELFYPPAPNRTLTTVTKTKSLRSYSL